MFTVLGIGRENSHHLGYRLPACMCSGSTCCCVFLRLQHPVQLIHHSHPMTAMVEGYKRLLAFENTTGVPMLEPSSHIVGYSDCLYLRVTTRPARVASSSVYSVP
jgi:hypothetical protein